MGCSTLINTISAKHLEGSRLKYELRRCIWFRLVNINRYEGIIAQIQMPTDLDSEARLGSQQG